MKNYKITFVTAVWKRPEVFALFAKGIHNLEKRFPKIKFNTAVSGSEGEQSKAMVEDEGFLYVECENQPLGKKMNKALELGLSTNADYYILLGSDDIICENLFKLYLSEIDKGTEYIYVTDGYFYDLISQKALYWAGYRKSCNRGHALGAGRVLKSDVLKRTNGKLWYDDRLNNLLDTAFDEITKGKVKTKKAFKCYDEGVVILDIKTSTNMTPFAQWDNARFIKPDYIYNRIPYIQ